jgi:hypothetical protein
MTSIFDNMEEVHAVGIRSIADMVNFWREEELSEERVPHMVQVLPGFSAKKLNRLRHLFYRIDQATETDVEFNSVLDNLLEVFEDPKFPPYLRPEHVVAINKEISKGLGGKITAVSKTAMYNLEECYYRLLYPELGEERDYKHITRYQKVMDLPSGTERERGLYMLGIVDKDLAFGTNEASTPGSKLRELI